MHRPLVVASCLLGLLLSCDGESTTVVPEPPAGDPPEVVAGERLFLETRFAQFFFQFLQSTPSATVNSTLPGGDPALEDTVGVSGTFPGPFRGLSMNCRACHLVDELETTPGAGIRTYCDFARRSPIPDRGDGRTTAPRNSPPLVNGAIDRSTPFFFHFDGEFSTLEDLVRATFSGRNFGWLPVEQAQAVAHLAKVIREDDGTGDLAAGFGGLPYSVLLNGSDLPPAFRIDVNASSDQEIADAVARLVAAYTASLLFSQDSGGTFNASPFDVFLAKNGLPRNPDPGESEQDYARRLRGRVQDPTFVPVWVTPADGAFEVHAQAFEFGPDALQGLRIFLAEPAGAMPTPGELSAGAIGNCIACHAPPKFSDLKFHNVGVAQTDFDAVHGAGSFVALTIPTLAQRSAHPDLYLPASPARPAGQGPFLAVPSASNPGLTDLGLWNVFANDAVPAPQSDLRALLAAANPPTDLDLDRTVALFKTPTLRDLGQSGPYFHTGQKDTLEDVVAHYVDFSQLARAGQVRNEDPELSRMALLGADVAALSAFLRTLNEDYR
jgi:hypothetical protein